jgi:ketosteroid isomerase-like protein
MDDVTSAITAQAAAWNRGDLEGFCEGYTDDAIYVSARGLRRGRDQILAAYREAYPDRTAMGTLSLEVLGLEDNGVNAMVVLRWSIDRGPDGHALLGFRRTDAGWRLAFDATVG